LILFPAVTLTFFLQNGVAQDYTQIRLPDGATARLGKGATSDIAYSPNGEHLAVAGSLGVWIYDAQSGDEIDLLIAHRDGIRDISFSPDGRTLASGSWDRTIRLWDVDTGSLKNTLWGRAQPVYSVAFSPDGKTLASGSDNTIFLWDVDMGSLKDTLTGHKYAVYSVAFSPDAQTLASGSWDNTIRLWDVNTGTLKHTITRN